MKIFDGGEGHHYLLEGDDYETEIKFFKDAKIHGLGHGGILIQELIRVAIDRIFYLNHQQPCQENIEIITHLRAVLVTLESRATRRKLEKMLEIESQSTCKHCGHILCEHNKHEAR